MQEAAKGERANRTTMSLKNVCEKLSEYGSQLEEKQKVKEMYGMREATI